jgi:hypothetical protein
VAEGDRWSDKARQTLARFKASRKAQVATAATGGAMLLGGMVVSGGTSGGPVYSGRTPTPGGGGTITCNQSSTSAADLTSDLAAISNGQTLCLTNAVSYGSFTGTNKTITIIAQSGTGTASPVNATMTNITLGSGDSGFTLDGGRSSFGSTGLTVASGADIEGGASNLTIKNTSFTNQVFVDGGSTDGIVLDGNQHNWPADSNLVAENAKIFLASGLSGTIGSPAVTVKNSQIWNGDLDGIHIGGGSGMVIDSNDLNNICQNGPNHTDNIQTDTSVTTNVQITKNFVHQTTPCGTQGVTSYDNGSSGYIVEDNVISIRWGPVLELYGDQNSTVRHNTLQFFLADPTTADLTHCEFFNQTCGKMIFSHKTGTTAGSGTHAYDNIATTIEFTDGSTGTADHNMCRETGCTGTGTLNSTAPTYVGGTSPTTYAGFCLTAGSAGHAAASDGLDIGIRC